LHSTSNLYRQGTGLRWSMGTTITIFLLLALTLNPTAASATTLKPSFNGPEAYSYLQSQMVFGNRIPNTTAHQNCVNYIAATLKDLGLTVSYQNFTGSSGEGLNIPFVNIIGVLNANNTTQRRIFLTAHYDTRPFSDHDIDGRPTSPDYSHPVPGANDGASGVAVLLELARVMQQYNRTRDIYFIFFDGEDYGTNEGSMLYGSKYYASHMSEAEVSSTDYLVLLDMIGDKELTIYREGESDMGLMDSIFSKAEDLGISQFINTTEYNIIDDHIPFKDRHMKVVDLIDFDYPNKTLNYWHTPADTIDKVSIGSLEATGKVVEGFLDDSIVSHTNNGGGNNNNTTPPPPKPHKDPKFIPGFEGPVLVATVAIVILLRYRRSIRA